MNGLAKNGVVIVGAGHGGVDLAFALRERGYEGRITVLDKSGCLPYQRPPLSKSWINGSGSPAELSLRGDAAFLDAGIDLLLNAEVLHIDREKQLVESSSGSLPYSTLVLALGSSPGSSVLTAPRWPARISCTRSSRRLRSGKTSPARPAWASSARD